MSPRLNAFVIALVAAGVVAWIAVDIRRSHEQRPNDVAAPVPASAAEPPITLFDGGYAVGPGRNVEAVLRAQTAQTRTGCQTPPPNAEQKAQWRSIGGPLASLSVSQLTAHPDDELVRELEGRLQDRIYGSGYAAMSREEQNVYLAYVLEAEVVNGGLTQFFENSSGNCALRTKEALDEIGLRASYDEYVRALSVFPDSAPSDDRGTRLAQMDALTARARAKWEKHETLEQASIGLHEMAFNPAQGGLTPSG